MGFLNKFLAYRWMSGGTGSGGGGGGELGLIMMVFVGIMALLFGIAYLVGGIISAIYTGGRALLSPAPALTAPLAGVALASLLAHWRSYSRKRAIKILVPKGEDSSFGFYVKGGIIFALVCGLLYIAGTGIIGGDSNIVVALIVLYIVYKMVQMPYRYARLLRHAPSGTTLMTACLTPMMTLVVLSLFDLTDEFWATLPLEILHGPLAIIAVMVPYTVPLWLIKHRAEPHILPKNLQSAE
ncbi:hypothetical protein [Salinibaculum rarum]|uniref:hypothetical protein n=1 Tax=Salinibaculum rarum TaxID=3058903 RepID=UPI0026604070|nr:hypothetical protein [Salinibaculum sp. KK48]